MFFGVFNWEFIMKLFLIMNANIYFAELWCKIETRKEEY